MRARRAKGYREAVHSSPEAPGPTGELLEPTDEDRKALSQARAREWSSPAGMGVLAMILGNWVAPALGAIPLLSLVTVIGALVLFVYALILRFRAPRGVGPMIVNLSPEEEVVAGSRLDVSVLLRPREQIELDPLTVCLTAHRSEGGTRSVAYESKHVLAERQVVEADRAVRLQTSILIADDAPATSYKRRTEWRVDVTLGSPPIARRSLEIRVRRAPKRRPAR